MCACLSVYGYKHESFTYLRHQNRLPTCSASYTSYASYTYQGYIVLHLRPKPCETKTRLFIEGSREGIPGTLPLMDPADVWGCATSTLVTPLHVIPSMVVVEGYQMASVVGGGGCCREVVVVGQAQAEQPHSSTTTKLTDHSRSTSTTFEGSPNRLEHHKYLAWTPQ